MVSPHVVVHSWMKPSLSLLFWIKLEREGSQSQRILSMTACLNKEI